MIFRELSEEEAEDFRRYAWKNAPDLSKWELMHPVCREVWVKRGLGPKPDADQPKV